MMTAYRCATCVILAAVCLMLTACETYRIEHRRLPSYYWQASEHEIPNRITLDDGTVVVQEPINPRRRRAGEADADNGNSSGGFSIREERDDGTVILHAPDPEHVLRHLLGCLQNEEYDLIYEQLLSTPSREVWESQDKTIDDFAAYFMRHRRDLARTVHRLTLGLTHNETYTRQIDRNVIEFQLTPRVAEGLEFSRVRVLIEPEGCRLVTIR